MTPALIKDPANNTPMTHTIASNAKWKLASREPDDATNAFNISTIKLDGVDAVVGNILGTELENNAHDTSVTLSYTINTGTTMSRFSKLTFSDSESPVRFYDVILAIYQCSNVGISPKMSDWATLAGFPGVPETQTLTNVEEVAQLKRDTPHPTTGIAWHRDQDGNIFLSASFHSIDITGDSDRWMITNLAAKNYVANAERTGSDNTVQQALSKTPSGASNYTAPLWAYPNTPTDPSTYTGNPRIGLLYNWAAATNSKASISDGEDADAPQTAIIQGICPAKWHLPSDEELTALEIEINTNTTAYSSATANADGPITVGYTGDRGSTHGKAMKEGCEPYSSTHQGISNPISTVKRPGFEVLLAGAAYDGVKHDYGSHSYLWSASGGPTNSWIRDFSSNASHVNRRNRGRNGLFSVRCKKDN
jgi:uncharacterized protein (TIGR02145 family)